MNEQTARNLLMDYLYDEISEADREQLETYLSNHPDLQNELEEMQKTRLFLQQMPETESPETLLLVEPGADSEQSKWQNVKQLFPKSAWRKAMLAAAACILFTLVIGSIVNLSVESTANGFSVHLGYAQTTTPAKLSEEQTEEIIQQVRKENTAILTEYADMLNKHNQQQLQQVVKYFEKQRLNDLQLVDQAMGQYQQKTDHKLQQTNQVLGEVLQTVASNDQP